MKSTVLKISFIILYLAVSSFAQNTLLRGGVSDENFGAIEKVKVTAVSKSGDETTVTTDEEGSYEILLSSEIFLLRFTGVRGFRNTEVKYCPSSKRKLRLNIKLEADPEGFGVMYSEFVCDKDDKDGNNCGYVSRLGKGTTKPKMMTFNCSTGNQNKNK